MFRLFAALAFCVGAAVSLTSFTRAAEAVIPAPQSSATPAPMPTAVYDRYVAVDVLLAPRVSNAFAPHATGTVTQDVRAALEYRFLGRNFVEFEYRRFHYAHSANDPARGAGAACPATSGDPGCVTQLGGRISAYVPAARLTEQQFELHTSLFGRGHAYVATSIFGHVGASNDPRLHSDFGIGAELLPALERPFSLSAAYYYYPETRGTYVTADGTLQRLRYKVETFDLRAHAKLPGSPLFLEIGVYGDRYFRKENSPSDTTHRAFDLGFGVHV